MLFDFNDCAAEVQCIRVGLKDGAISGKPKPMRVYGFLGFCIVAAAFEASYHCHPPLQTDNQLIKFKQAQEDLTWNIPKKIGIFGVLLDQPPKMSGKVGM